MLVALTAAVALSALGAAEEAMPIGFVSHFPMVRHEDDKVADTGASAIIVRAPWALIEPREGEFDYSILDQQLVWADAEKLKLVYILESGPAHAAGVPWLVEKLQAAGETMVEQSGSVARDPSLFSPTYRRYLSRFIENTVRHLASHPLSHVVYGYDNGCEWWYQLQFAYGPLDVDAFRKRLEAQHGSIAALNGRWGARYESWQAVSPPKLVSEGMGELPQGYLISAGAAVDACYCTTDATHVPVIPGRACALTVECDASALECGAIRAEIAWLKADDPRPMAIAHSKPLYQATEDGRLELRAAAPEGAARAWLLLKLTGVGAVTFRHVSFTEGEGRELAPNVGLDPNAGGWQFIQWNAGEPQAVSHEWKAPGHASIAYGPSCTLDSGAQYPLAEVHDWLDFRYTAMAEFLDWFAAEIKHADPTRPVVTYLTFAFADPFEWDYTEHMAIALDYIARRAEHQDILGMQLASTAGDYDSVTCALDLVRKYGKPMWAIDLQDFSLGTGLGQAGLTRLSLSVLQHGGSGIQYYCWWGTPVYNYMDLGVPPLQEMIGEVRSAADRLSGARPECDVALVMPRMPLYRFLPEPANDWADLMGWYKLLVRLGMCPDIYTLEDLPGADLSRYRAVIVPDCAYMPREVCGVLARREGGRPVLITSGRFAHRDMTGRPLPASLSSRKRLRFDTAVGAEVLGETYRHPSPTDTPTRLRCAEGSPHLDLPVVSEIEDRLRRAGVRLLHHAGEAPVTTVPFRAGKRRMAFVLPDRDWEGKAKVGARQWQVGRFGEIVPSG
jgi:Beta-galactosidase